MAIKTYTKTDRINLSKNFNLNEFICKGNGCCTTAKIDVKLVDFLQKIRDHFNAPVTINSAYRCATHNKNVGGASSSYHTKGQAADIVVKNVKPSEVAKYAESIGVKGIGLYETAKDGYFVHIDTRTSKSFWYGQGQTPRSTFGGKVSTVVISSAVKNWQKAAIADNFTFKSGADGIWGKECEAVATYAVCKRCFFPWKFKNLTKIIQKAVGVTVDGKFGAGTKNAVITCQKKNGLVADGIVGIKTWKKILGVK